MCTRGAERTKALMKVPACISSLVSLGERAETSWPRQSRSGRRFQPTYECQDVWSEKELAVPCIEHIRMICFLHCDFYVSYRSYFWADCEKQKIRISNSECIIHPHGRTSCFFWKKCNWTLLLVCNASIRVCDQQTHCHLTYLSSRKLSQETS